MHLELLVGHFDTWRNEGVCETPISNYFKKI
jgi:hypothetical protein